MSSESTNPAIHQAWPYWNLFIRFWAFSTLVLFALTWKLWGTGIEGVDFPSIPIFDFVVAIPTWVNFPILLLLVSALLGLIIVGGANEISRSLYFAVAVSLLILFVLNQHRLQPWAYQAFIFSTLFAILPSCVGGPNHSVAQTQHRPRLVGFLRLILASIYIYSAISKFDYQFIHSTGETFLTSLMSWIGISIDQWQPNSRAWAVSTFPIGELLIGIGLLVPLTRRFAVVAALALHGTLILLLGRLGHSGAVLVWNFQFAILVLLLFWVVDNRSERRQKEVGVPKSTYRSSTIFALLFTLAIVIAPLLKPIGWCDHWLAWGALLSQQQPSRSAAAGNNLPQVPAVDGKVPQTSPATDRRLSTRHGRMVTR